MRTLFILLFLTTMAFADTISSKVFDINGCDMTFEADTSTVPDVAGNFIALICRSAGVWTTLGQSGAWVTNGS